MVFTASGLEQYAGPGHVVDAISFGGLKYNPFDSSGKYLVKNLIQLPQRNVS